MPSNQLSRKDFIRNSSLLLASSSMFPGRSFIQAKDERQKERSTYTLKNVRLETGFIYDDDNNITATKTALFSLKIEDGKIAAIHENRNIPGAIDAKGYLMLPAFKDMHIHLDKTFYGGPWRAKSPKNRSVKDMIAFEQQNLPEMLKTSTEKAERIIELLQSKGSYFARSHVNIEPTSKLQSLKNLQEALENKKNSFGAELVAFPQHGIYYTESAPIMKDAAQMGIDYIGG
ncbi:amidohydrolase family protein [Chitinophaga caeni]|uniref:hypothetical protein n=1 Tax=Chitinophaga caeni TaxID=2029983 RepID=UPI001E2C8B82|nr:hypothetical protein [Chitinophaga caeni]